MDQTLILYTAIGVFTLMVIGLGLTIWEFSRGNPKEQSRLQDERLVRVRSSESSQFR